MAVSCSNVSQSRGARPCAPTSQFYVVGTEGYICSCSHNKVRLRKNHTLNLIKRTSQIVNRLLFEAYGNVFPIRATREVVE